MVRSTTASMCVLAAVFGCQPSEGKSPGTQAVTETADAPKDTKSAAQLNVEVFYRERMMLPPTSTLQVVLEDGALMDVAAVVIAKTEVPIQTGPPYSVTLEYDPSKLNARGRYGVRARIENEGRLMFTSTQFNPAFGTHGSVDEPPHDPVKVLVSRVTGTSASAGASITGTRWVLETLRGKPAGVGAGGRAPEITLQGSEPRASGFTGCNQITGGYELQGEQLSFGNMAMTMRACDEGMDLEREFAKVIGETKSYRIDGNTLSFRDQAGTVIAVFEAG